MVIEVIETTEEEMRLYISGMESLQRVSGKDSAGNPRLKKKKRKIRINGFFIKVFFSD